MRGNAIGRAAESAAGTASDLRLLRHCPRANTAPEGSPCWKDRAASGLRRGLIAGLGLVFAGTVSAQAPLAVPVGADGKPEAPEGMTLETVDVIETLAGTGAVGYGGDGGPASRAFFRFPRGVAADASGNIYVADSRDHRIRKIDSEGTITTLAGNGERGYGGDGGPATLARLDHPEGVAADGVGNVYVADSENHRIRKIDAAGIITTIVGTGVRGDQGDGGPAAEARLSFPAGVAVDGEGSVYVADSWNHRVRRIDRGGTITTLAGRGFQGYVGNGGPAAAAALANPTGVAVDSEGNVYVADTWNHRVRRIDDAGVITTLAGSGQDGDGGDGRKASIASLGYPAAVAADPGGNLYVSSYSFVTANRRVRRIDQEGLIEAFAGTGGVGYGGDRGPAVDAWLAYPMGVAADAEGNIYVADAHNARVRVVRPGLQVRIPLGESGDSVALVVASAGELRIGGEPAAVGTRVEADSGNSYSLQKRDDGVIFAEYVPSVQTVRVGRRVVTLAKQEDGTWHHGDEPAANGYRVSIGGRTYLLELADGRWSLPEYVIDTVAGGNTAVADGVAATAAGLASPWDVAVDAAGNVYIAEADRPRIRKVDGSGVITTVAGTGEWGSDGDGGPAAEAVLYRPRWLAADQAGNLFVADEFDNRIRKIDRAGVDHDGRGHRRLLLRGGRGGRPRTPASGIRKASRRTLAAISTLRTGGLRFARSTPRESSRPSQARTVSRASAETAGRRRKRCWTGRSRSQRMAPTMSTSQIRDNHRIRVIDPAGTITTFAGSGQRGFAGDGGPAAKALLNRPVGVAVDGVGNVFVADERNRRIRKIDRLGVITTFAGTGRCCVGR